MRATTPIDQASVLVDALRAGGLPIWKMAYLLATLVLLRWADFEEAENEAVAVFEGRLYEPALDVSFHWRNWSNLGGDELWHRLDDVKAGLDLTNPHPATSLASLRYVWDGIHDLLKIDEEPRTYLVKWLAAQPFETPTDRHRLLQQLDALLERASLDRRGEFRTPKSICQLMVEMVAPQQGESVYDPCFGIGEFLTRAVDYVQGLQAKEGRLRGTMPIEIYGVERVLENLVIGQARLALAGVTEPHLDLGNSLERNPKAGPVEVGYDVGFANPPFGSKVEPMGLGHIPIQTSDAAALFIQHTLSQLKPGGRAAIVVPQGLLFRGGIDRQFRRWLTEGNAVEAVVSLGSGAFFPFASIQASILVLRRGDRSTRIRFVDAEALFDRIRETRGRALSESAIAQIVEAVKSPIPSEISWDQTLEEIAHLEWDLTPKRRGQSDFHSVLDSISKQMPVLPLSELASISGGVAARSADMLDEPTEGSLPIIRTKDIERGVASRATSWILPNTKGVAATHKLRGGDILLSKSGTIGKSGIVRNGAIGAVASSGLFDIHVESDQIDPHYLLAYLNSADCRSWLADQATGATIQHLAVGVLRDLRVPIPPLQVQLRIAEQFRDQETDALGFLALVSGAAERDPISEWVESALRMVPSDGEPIDEPLEFLTLERFIGEMKRIRNRAAHDQESGPLVPWLLIFHEALNRLQGIQLVPRGASQLSLLQDAASGLERAVRSLSGREAHTARARSLSLGVQRLINAAIEALASNVAVSFSSGEEILLAGDKNIIYIKVANNGALPLRNLVISTSPDWGSENVTFLGEEEATSIQFGGEVSKGTESFQLEISWSAESLDGRKAQGRRQVAFDVEPERISLGGTVDDLGPSPYVCGNPIRPGEKVFFGRDELIADIRTTVQEKGNVILLEGNRRAGKSSILAHLEGLKGIHGWLCVSASLQGAEGDQARVGVPTEDVFRALAKAIADALCLNGLVVPLPTGEVLEAGTTLNFQTRRRILEACRTGIPEEGSFSYFREFLVAALESAANSNVGIVLMLDEFDKLQEGIDSHVTSPQVPENIRSLVQTLPRFSAILTGSRRITRLREEYWSVLFGLGTAFPVSSLSEEAALSLVLEPIRGRLVWTTEAAQHALNITARQPYILQCLCNEVFLLASETRARSVSIDMVRKAASSDTLWQHFASLWDYPGNDRRRFILALCEKYAAEDEPYTFATLKESLAAYGVQTVDETLDTDLDHLIELEMVRRTAQRGSTTYKLEIPLMGDWIRTTQDFDVLKMRAIVYSENTNG